MNKLSKIFMAAALGTLAVGGASLVSHHEASADTTGTVGSLRGVLKDKGNKNEPAVGATVVATSPALQGEQVVITDDTGQYFITSLPPGVYTLTVYYNDATYSRGNVLIQIGKEAVVNVSVDSAASTGKPKGETIIVQGTAPIIDQGSTKTGVTLTDDYTRNIPTGRTFGGVLGAAAGAQDDAFGESMSGATSVENTYIVEGINTTDTSVGLLASNLPNEFVSETEIITGGYNAEYGRATGGIVNVVTKSGSNEFHGSVWGYLTPGSFISAAKVVQNEGGSIDTKSDVDVNYDIGAEVGGPIIKDKLWFHVGFQPSVSNTTLTRLVQSQVDDNQDGIPDVDPNTGLLKHVQVASTQVPTSLKTYYFTAKLSGAIDQNNQGQLSVFGNPRTGNEIAGLSGIVFSPGDQTLNVSDGTVDTVAKWTSKFNEGKTQIDAIAGYHAAWSNQSAGTALGQQALVQYGYERPLTDFSDLEGAAITPSSGPSCSDGPGDKYPKITNCPVTNYADGGLGLLEDRVNDRTSGSLTVTQRAKALGYHTLKAGVDTEFSTYNSDQEYTGGEFLKRLANDPTTGAPGQWEINSYYTIVRSLTPAEAADPTSVTLAPGQVLCSNNHAICAASGSLKADTTDRSIGAFIQDSWQIRPNFELNFGVRYEQQQGGIAKQQQGTITPQGETVGTVGFTLNNWAPRIGFNFDPTDEGKAKIFGHWGRFYENIPLDLNVRGFGGEIDNIGLINATQKLPGQPGYMAACNVDHMANQDAAKTLMGCQDFQQLAILGGGVEYVTPGVQGQYTDEFILGTEYEIMPDVKIGANWMHRTMPMVLEDILTPDGEYFITNPSQDFTSQANSLAATAARELTSSDPKVVAQGQLDQYRATEMAKIKTFDPPSRNYDALTLQATQRPTKKSLILASYTFSRETGNYPGLFSTETLQLDPNGSSQYDLRSLMANRYGPMGLDRPHNLKIDGFYMFDLHEIGLITVGASARAQSGIPHNALGYDPVYGQGEAYLLPRGTFTRSPWTSEFDIHISYGRRLSKTTKLEGFVNVFNLFNEQQEATTDENYTFDGSLPIVGGTVDDLKHLKKLDANGVEGATTVLPNPNFGKTLSYQQLPRSVQLGFRLTF